jgi:O-antigen/teichoic acid export membrane protein
MSSKTDREDILGSALLMTGATYINYGSGILASLVIARSLGPAEYGQYAYLVWLSGLLVALFNHGLTTTAITFISERLGGQDRRGAAVVHSWLNRQRKYSIAIVAIAFAIAIPFVRPAGWQEHLWLFVALTLVSALTKAAYILGISVAKGYGLFSIEALISNLFSVLSLLCVLAIAWFGGSLQHYLGLFVLMCAGHAMLSYAMLKRAGITPLADTLDEAYKARISNHLLWTTALVLIGIFSNKSIETFLLNSTTGPEAVGFFLIAAALTRGGVELLSSGLNSVLMSHMAHAFGAGGEDPVNRVLSNNIRYFHFLGLLLAGVGYFWAAPLITLMYGEKYLEAIYVFQIMVVVAGLVLADGVFGARLSTTGSQKVRALIVCSTLLFSAVAAFVLVPKFGLKGAVVSNALSLCVGFCVVAGYTSNVSGVRLPYREACGAYALAISVAAMCYGISLVVPGHLGLIAAGAAFAVCYVAGSVVFRVWTSDDLAGLSSILARLPIFRQRTPNLERWGRRSN